jgi:hypothetical protein
MKTWTDLSAISMPPRVAALPRDTRGYPVPHSILFDTHGVPDFRVIDVPKWLRAARNRCCGLCGEPLGVRVAFVGGPLAMEHRLFTDLPSHLDCAIYAMQTCPFLAAPKFAYSRHLPTGTKVNEHITTERPERFGIGIARGYALRRIEGDHLVLHAQPFERIEWWVHGKRESA